MPSALTSCLAQNICVDISVSSTNCKPMFFIQSTIIYSRPLSPWDPGKERGSGLRAQGHDRERERVVKTIGNNQNNKKRAARSELWKP